MMKKIFLGLVLLLAVMSGNAQVQSLKAVNYRGAFAPAPTAMWTDGWANWDPNNTVYGTPNVTISDSIRTNTTWTKNNVYQLQGLIYVTNNATLTIEPGTVIRAIGDTSSIKNTSLVVTRGAKLYAVGTATEPIVFTSGYPAGSREPGQWGGIIILGKAPINVSGGQNYIEGIAQSAVTAYGGTDANDNSGTLKYVRCEFGGFIFQPNKEINGFTFGGVGRGTTIDYVQSSFANDDAFEWFGGTVNCSHLVSYRGVDDEFDTDNGFSGTVQFCLGVRDPNLYDATYAAASGASTSEGFESDNDANGTNRSPFTSAIFSNVTLVGPLRGNPSANNNSGKLTSEFKRCARIRRNSRLKIVNSVLMDYPSGLFIDNNFTAVSGETNGLTTDAAKNGTMIFANNLIAGTLTGRTIDWGTPWPASSQTADYPSVYAYFAKNNNDSSASTSGILTSPYSFTSPDYRPATGSPALSNYNFTSDSIAPYVIKAATNKNFVTPVTYRGAFAPAPTAMWTSGWANWDPNNTVYGTPNVIVSDSIRTNTTWTKNNVYQLQGLIYVTNNATLTIEPGTVIRAIGDTSSIKNTSLIITRGAKLYAVGTAAEPIVFTSGYPAGSREPGQWGGIIILGKAPINVSGGQNFIEGIAQSTVTAYGGTDADDNSGTLKYVRCEFGGFIFQPNKEINGFTFGGVGRGTTIDYVQSSFANDDAFEWFGGTVNCSHLISYRGVDDEFDTDNGFSGTVQFCLGVRDPNLYDATYAAASGASTSEGFESDNDANGTNRSPFTSAIFSNVTLVGPLRGNPNANNNSGKLTSEFKRCARIRRNSRLKIVNSVLMDYPSGVFIDNNFTAVSGETNGLTTDAAKNGLMRFSNNLIAGTLTGRTIDWGTPWPASSQTADYPSVYAYFAKNNNDSSASTSGILTSPYNFTSPDYRPATGSPALSNYNFADTIFNDVLNAASDLVVPSSYATVISGDTTYNDVTLSGGTLTINAGKTLTINGTLSLTSGTIINNGGSIVYGGSPLTVGSGSTVNFNGTFSNNIVNNGTINLTDNSTFAGNVTNNGVITGAGSYLNAKKLTLSGSNVNVNGNGSIGVLEINSNGTITNSSADSLKILNKLILTKGVLASNGKLTIKSTSLDSTAIVDVVAAGSVSGNVVAERFIPAKFRAYRDLTPGVNTNGGTIFSNWQEGGNKTAGYGIFITGTKGTPGSFDATSGLDYTAAGSASAYSYRNGIWSAYSTATNQSTKSGALANLDYHYGFRVLVRGDRGYNIAQAGLSPYFMVNKTTVRATGTLVTGDVVYNTTNSLNPALNGYSMIGNPYLAPLDWDAVTGEPSYANSKLLYAYNFISRNDSTNNDGPTGALSFYVTYEPGLGATIAGVNAQYIMPGSAFFVQNDGTGATGSFTIKEAHKAANNSRKQYGLFSASASKSLYVSLYKNTEVGYQKADGIKLVVNKTLAANRGVNKFANASDNLSIVDGNKSYAIAGYKNLTATDTINLALSQLTEGTSYKLNVTSADFNVEGLTPYLLDKNTNTTTELKSEGTSVTFTASNATRYAIIFSAKTASTTIASAISAFPNPLVGNTLHLSTSSLAAGKYNVTVYNVLGKKVFTAQIEGASRTQSLKVGSLTAGSYNVVVSNSSKAVYSTVLQVK